MTAHEDHNRLAKEYVLKVVKQTSSESDLMVVMESCILATMLVLNRQYGFAPSGCVELIEAAIQRATERFAAEKPKGGAAKRG